MIETRSPQTIEMNPESITIQRTVDGKPTSSRVSRPGRTTKGDSPETPDAAKRRLRSDPYIWGIYCCILVVAVIELFSASSGDVKTANVYEPLIRQIVFLGVGFCFILGLQRIHYGYISRYATAFAVVTGLLLLYADLWGAVINGAQRSIMIGSFSIQPAEISKLAVVVVLAMILGRNQKQHGVSTRGILWSAIVVGIFAALTFRNGMTNMVIIMGASLVMMLVGGIPIRKLLIVLLSYGMMYCVFTFIKKESEKVSEFDAVANTTMVQTTEPDEKVDRGDMRLGRVSMWLKGTHPDDKMTDDNRQDMLGRMAQAHGGFKGRGPGNSRESSRLPLASSDYIYSIIVEDTGFIGGVVLIILYLCIIARAGVLAWRFKRAFPAFLIMGCATLVVLQALVHMAIVTGAMPVSGQPLPLISKGGTSVLVMSIAFGIMLSVSRFADQGDTTKQTRQQESTDALPDDLQAANITSYNTTNT